MIEAIFNLIIGGLAIFFLWCAIFSVIGVAAGSECSSLGYPKSIVSTSLTTYCVKRVDQTDVVVPLTKLKENK